MGDLSIAIVVGRLTRDAELKYTSSGQAVCSFSVATGSRVKKADQWVDESSFWDVDLWGKRAESINQYLTKGKLVAVEGAMRQDRWEKDGVQRMKVRINANDVQLVGGGAQYASGGAPSGSAAFGGEGQARQAAAAREPAASQPAASQPAASMPDDFTDDIPF